MAKFIIGGRMGDAIHQLYVIKHWPGGPHDLYITDRRDLHSDGFIYDLETTIAELKPVLLYQDYIKSVQAYDGPVTEEVSGEWINLNMWRRWVYSASWTNLLSKVYGVPIIPGPWMDWWVATDIKKLVHCSIHEARRGNWESVNLTGFKFMGSHDEYKNFRRPDLKFVSPGSLSDIFDLLHGCGEFVGNQSLPLAIAHALDVPRTAVLNEVDCKAYVGEEKINSKFKYVL